ncbi:MAG TPA: alpha/beta hydrolase [Dehalococcoidia bacterium]|nr:alpha/beta hydrolase [Dehalococcoidia bacterium]
MVEPRSFRERVNGIELQVYEWPGDGPPVVLAHATGFHSRCWDQVVTNLTGRHIFAWDTRGHGFSDTPEPPYPWNELDADSIEIVGRLGVEDAVGVGHSMGGHHIVTAAAGVPGAFSRLLLVDPVLHPREEDQRPAVAAFAAAAGDHFVARRRNEWASPAEMFESFRERSPFNVWLPQALHDYCRYGLVPKETGGGYVLACPPPVEAAVYAGSTASNPRDAVASIDFPVRILRARTTAPGQPRRLTDSPTLPNLAGHFKDAEEISLPEHSHFVPMEAPELVASHIKELAGV